MNKILSGFVVFTFIIISCNSQPKKTVWTKKYEEGLYNYLDSTSKATIPDEKKRRKYVEFFVARAKQELPNGINSVSKDSLHSLNTRIGQEYAWQERGTGNADVVQHYEKWSPFVEKAFRSGYIAVYRQKYPTSARKFCECMIKKMKEIYPDSVLIPLPKDVNLKITISCRSVLVEPDYKSTFFKRHSNSDSKRIVGL